jgi:competence ComEA-like helix-hairpin-helix protein
MRERIWLVAILCALGLGYFLNDWLRDEMDQAPKKVQAEVIGSEELHQLPASPPLSGEYAPLDPNIATLEELVQLPGIGPVLAERIVRERERASFRSIDDLQRVSGIGPHLLDRLRVMMVIAEDAKD